MIESSISCFFRTTVKTDGLAAYLQFVSLSLHNIWSLDQRKTKWERLPYHYQCPIDNVLKKIRRMPMRWGNLFVQSWDVGVPGSWPSSPVPWRGPAAEVTRLISQRLRQPQLTVGPTARPGQETQVWPASYGEQWTNWQHNSNSFHSIIIWN